jgi:hypothetical protein
MAGCRSLSNPRRPSFSLSKAHAEIAPGTVTAWAEAASSALPPWRKMSSAVSVAIGIEVAAMPLVP